MGISQKDSILRVLAVCLIFLVLVFNIATVTAATEDRYSYITVEHVTIRLDNQTAIIDMNYSVDENTHFIFFLFGDQDLKTKLLKILNYDKAKFNHIDLSTAELIVNSSSYSYGNGAYWYPSHEFNVAIPELTIETPQASRNFTMANNFPNGMGYFSNFSRPSAGNNILSGNEISSL